MRARPGVGRQHRRLLWLGWTLALLWPAWAWAASEGEWEAGASAAAASLRDDGRWAPGLQLGLEGQRGLTELWSLRLGVMGSLHAVDATAGAGGRPSGMARTAVASAGLVYALDVFRVVPFAELGASFWHLTGRAAGSGAHAGYEASLGASYLLDPRWSLAAALRFQHAPIGGGSPLILSVGLRLSRLLR